MWQVKRERGSLFPLSFRFSLSTAREVDAECVSVCVYQIRSELNLIVHVGENIRLSLTRLSHLVLFANTCLTAYRTRELVAKRKNCLNTDDDRTA